MCNPMNIPINRSIVIEDEYSSTLQRSKVYLLFGRNKLIMCQYMGLLMCVVIVIELCPWSTWLLLRNNVWWFYRIQFSSITFLSNSISGGLEENNSKLEDKDKLCISRNKLNIYKSNSSRVTIIYLLF